jgi:hypothetical protein
VRVVFADTFYWIALTFPGDAAYARTNQVTDDVVTTEEVLTEYLTFFCAAPEYLRREVAALSPGLNCTAHVPTKAIAWSIASRCRRCARNG